MTNNKVKEIKTDANDCTDIPELNKMIEEAALPESRAAAYKKFTKQLQQALFYFTDQNVFIGGLLQEMNFKPDHHMPTACLKYDKKRQSFEVLVGPEFFDRLTLAERIAVLHHEILHFTNAHVFRLGLSTTDKEEHKKNNLGADMAINQYISNLPKGCVNVKYFTQDDGTPFPTYATAEVYVQLLKDNPDALKNAAKAMQADGIEMQKDKDGNLLPAYADGETLDKHAWEELSDEEKKQMAEEMKKMIRRTMEKTQYGRSDVPGGIKDFIEEIESFLQRMDYRKILQSAIKKSVSFSDRASTWSRPNKRYGVTAKGTTLAKLPQLWELIDTSGSISVKELNDFLSVVDSFLRAGSRKCMIGFWHTDLYKLKKYKLGQQIKAEDIESGGTNMTSTVAAINKGRPDLSIILTDGYYACDVLPEVQCIVVISEGGTMDHPLKDHPMVKTISMKGLK